MLFGGTQSEWGAQSHSDDEDGDGDQDSNFPVDGASVGESPADEDYLMEDALDSHVASMTQASAEPSSFDWSVEESASQTGASLSAPSTNPSTRPSSSFFDDDDDDEPFDEEAFMDEAMAIAEAAERQLQEGTKV